MGFKVTINVLCRGNRDKMQGLLNLDAIVVIDKTHLSKVRLVFARKSEALANDIITSFGNVLVRAGESKMINLAKEKDLNATERGGINCTINNRTIVCCAFEVELRREEDRVDMTLP